MDDTKITRTVLDGGKFRYTLDGKFDGETRTDYVILKASKVSYPFAAITNLGPNGEMITFHKTLKAAQRGPGGPLVRSVHPIEINAA